jgi:hypothetical protein
MAVTTSLSSVIAPLWLSRKAMSAASRPVAMRTRVCLGAKSVPLGTMRSGDSRATTPVSGHRMPLIPAPKLLCLSEPDGSSAGARPGRAIYDGGVVAAESLLGRSEKVGSCTGSESRPVRGTASGS